MLFSKKLPDEEAMHNFWKWFSDNEQWIIETSKTSPTDVVFAVDEKLSPIFSYFKREIEFEFGYNDNQGEFFFFDLRNRRLHKDAVRLAELMPENLKERWIFKIMH